MQERIETARFKSHRVTSNMLLPSQEGLELCFKSHRVTSNALLDTSALWDVSFKSHRVTSNETLILLPAELICVSNPIGLLQILSGEKHGTTEGEFQIP